MSIKGLFLKLFGAFLLVLFCGFWAAHAAMTLSTLWLPIVLAILISGLLSWLIGRPIQRSLGRTVHQISDQLQQGVQELQSQRSQAQAILESMIEGVVALDREGRVLWLNGSAQQLFGVPSRQAEGKRLFELFRKPDLDDVIQSVLTSRRPVAREVRAFGPGAEVIRLQVVPCEGGERGAALVLVAQDVTEMRRLEGVRREFVANVSHELKTPLTSIKGLVETLLSGALEDPANNRRFVTLIDEDATRLSRLIDDLLQLSEIESKAVPLSLQPVSLRPLLDGVAAQLAQPLRERRITLEILVPADTPAVRGDPERLRQVFANLLDNAVKFNAPGGRVTVTAARRDARLEVAVQDTGPGIPEQDLPRIFERFYRVDKARSRELGGTGLGLSIVKHIIEAHGGRVSVASQPGRGSTFTVALPIASS